ncbi:AMP-binding protein [Streptantibioticus silvisoli]|uniref:AMP-binding protein n=1 Tax=Streptantibioticus silvisoli TaxID=2705255 RepID=A0ABT6W0G1_9ACTN|nr:AMP-binding protein [Streptantibioticus silvisoli]MDI5963006.1 AMP-binding protein [Streptantibioticus silvisoli]
MSHEMRTELIRPLHELIATHAAERPDKTAYHDARTSVTYGELAGRTGRLAGHLAALGLERGARAALCLGNRVEMVESYLAVTRAAAVGVAINPNCSDDELAYLLDDCSAALVITDRARADQVARVAGAGVGVVVVGPDEPAAGRWHYETLATTEPPAAPRDDLGLDEPAWMLYTSGTTGSPKGVPSTQRGSLWATASCNAPILGLCEDDRMLWPMPLFHCVAHNLCVLGVLAVGATAHIMDGLAAEEILRTVREERSTFLVGVPTMFHHMVEAALAGDVPVHDLRVCMVAGSACPEPLHEAFAEAFGISLLDSYGSTETGGAITTNWPARPRVPGSCGLPLPGLELRLTDPGTGQEVPQGAEGEIWVDSPAMMTGYHGKPAETAAVMSDGWYRTGDLARRDAAGYISITGRIKELIIRGGENIHPAEVERVLASVPGVAEAAVGGRAHDALGEVPVAYLVAGPEGIDAQLVLETCRARLSYFKIPDELLQVEAIPRTAAGKIARRELAGLPARSLAVNPVTAARPQQEGPAQGADHATPAMLGAVGAHHPLLGAVVDLPDSDAVVFTGRLSADRHDWLDDCLVAGTRGVPGSVLVELAVRAGDEVGAGRLENLVPAEPLVLPPSGGVQVRVTVGPAWDTGRRPLTVHSRGDGEVSGRQWMCHANGILAPDTATAAWDASVWPPVDAEPLPLPADPAQQAAAGHGRVRGVWRRGDEVFAEVALDGERAGEGAAFGLHPLLLDTAIHPLRAGLAGPDAGTEPGAWRGVSLHAAGAAVLRVRITPAEQGAVRIETADATGVPVLTVDSLEARPVSRARLRVAGAAQQDGLFSVEWQDVDLPAPADPRPQRWAVVGEDPLKARAGLMAAGQYAESYPDLETLAARAAADSVPDVVVVTCAPDPAAGQDVAAVTHRTTGQALGWARSWLTSAAFDGSRLVFLTRGAVPAPGDGPSPLPAAGAVWGLVRAAQSEAPGRFVLVDFEGGKPAWRAVRRALGSGEPQVAVHGRTVRVPVLEREYPAAPGPLTPALDGGTVLVAGGTGRLGALVARHLVAERGARDLLLVSRRGPDAPGAGDLRTELAALGARVTVAACDVTDRAALAGLLERLPADRPLTAVVHATGVADDGILTSLTPDRLSTATRSAVEGLAVLREVTAGLDLSAFWVFCTVAGVLGSAGRGAHAAAGAFVDAWAHGLRAEGVAARCVALGPWEPDGAAPAADSPERRRARRDGLSTVTAEQGLLLVDAAWSTGLGSVVAAPLDFTALRDRARAGEVPTLLRRLLPAAARRRACDTPAGALDLRQRTAAMTEEERDAVLLDLVRSQVAVSLGYASAEAVDAQRTMKEFGFDSLTALTVRNALNAATGLTLAQAVVFDFATPAALALHLKSELLAR